MPMMSMFQERYTFDSATVENAGPSMQRYVPPRWTLTAAARQDSSSTSPKLAQTGCAKVMCATIPSPKKVDSRARARAVEELFGADHVERRVTLLQRADRLGRKYLLDAEQLHRVDVRAERKLRRQKAVAATVARQEGDALAFERAHDERVRGRAERRVNRDLFDLRQLRHLVEAAAADDSDLGCGHDYSFQAVRLVAASNYDWFQTSSHILRVLSSTVAPHSLAAC